MLMAAFSISVYLLHFLHDMDPERYYQTLRLPAGLTLIVYLCVTSLLSCR